MSQNNPLEFDGALPDWSSGMPTCHADCPAWRDGQCSIRKLDAPGIGQTCMVWVAYALGFMRTFLDKERAEYNRDEPTIAKMFAMSGGMSAKDTLEALARARTQEYMARAEPAIRKAYNRAVRSTAIPPLPAAARSDIGEA